MARNLKITYGTLVVGLSPSNASFYLTDKYAHWETAFKFYCAFTVVIQASTVGTFRAAEQEFIAAASKRDVALTIALGGVTRHSYDPSANTGFLTRGQPKKVGSPKDTETSAEWLVEITGELPEDVSARAGRREGRTRVEPGPDERRVATFQGVYAALGADSAKAQFDEAKAAFANTELTALGGNWNQLPETFEYDDENKLLSFKLTYHEGSLGLRFGHVKVDPDATGRRMLEFSGVYAATGANTALQQYTAQVDTWQDAYIAAIGGVYNPLPRVYDYDEQDNLLRFNHRFEEIKKAESLAGTNLAAVVLPRLIIKRLKFGDRRASIFPDTSPWELVFISYSATVRWSETSDLETLYTGTLRPYLLAQVGAAVIVMREEKEFQLESNLIRAGIIARVTKGGIISSSVRTQRSTDHGVVLLPRWDGGTFSKADYPGIGSQTVVITVETLHTLGAVVPVERAIQAHITDPKFKLIFSGDVTDDGLEGVTGETDIQMVARTDMFVFARADKLEGGGGDAAPGDEDARLNAPGFETSDPGVVLPA